MWWHRLMRLVAAAATRAQAGAVVQRMSYVWFMAYTLLWHIFVYCPLAHYVFDTDGWVAVFGAVDFAGGLVVHTASGA